MGPVANQVRLFFRGRRKRRLYSNRIMAASFWSQAFAYRGAGRVMFGACLQGPAMSGCGPGGVRGVSCGQRHDRETRSVETVAGGRVQRQGQGMAGGCGLPRSRGTIVVAGGGDRQALS